MKTFLFFLIICAATHVIRTIYEILKHTKRINPENKVVFALIFTNMMALWVSWFMLTAFDPYMVDLAPVIRYSGAAIFMAGLLLFFLSLARLQRFENYHGALITDGVFRFFRHPMYVGFFLWMAGSSIYNRSGVALILTIVFTANIFIWKIFEEIQLRSTFPEYKDYMKKTLF